MELFSESQSHKLYQGNMLDMLEVIEPNSIDAIVTDPPYELNFMGKGWDRSGIAFQKETWEKCLKVLKPGGYLLAFGGSRTSHRIACAIEDAGFEIRDTIMWLYGSGFPKSMNIGLAIDKKNGVESELGGVKPGHQDFVNRTTNGDTRFEDGMSGFDRPWMHDEEKREAYHYEKLPTSEEAKRWQGFGTALKPAYEPIIVARKPCEGSCVDNVLKYGVGGINIDECRVLHNEPIETMHRHTDKGNNNTLHTYGDSETDCIASPNEQGRFPSNVVLTYDETDQEEVIGGMPDSEGCKPHRIYSNVEKYEGWGNITQRHGEIVGYADNGGSAARYYYCAKASKRDRDEGCGMLPDTKRYQQGNYSQSPICSVCGKTFNGTNDHSLCGDHTMVYKSVEENTVRKNTHPTVKPCSLMQYLIRLVTPKGGTILDPFNGSGSTGKAAMYENVDRNAGYHYIGIELTPEYLPIADARIRFALGDTSPVEYPSMSVSRPKAGGQISLFDIT